MVGSESEKQFLFNLSLSRLTISLVFFASGIVFLILAMRAFLNHRKGTGFLNKLLENEKRLWMLLALSVLIAGAMFFALTRQLNAYGEFKLIYQRLEPVIVWAAVISIQTAFFVLFWYSANFTEKRDKESSIEVKRDLLPVYGIFFAFTIIKLLFVTATAYGPTGRGDEMTYFDMADSFYRGFFSITQTHHYPPLYPLMLTPALVFRSWAFNGIKIINVILSTSIVFPVYLTSRSFLDKKKSLLAAILSCLIPYHLVFPRRIVSENLYFPLLMWTMYVTYARLKEKRNTIYWNILNGVLIGLLFLTRYITLATIPFFLAAWWVKPFTESDSLWRPSGKKILHLAVLIGVMVAVFSPWVISAIRDGLPVKLALGFGVASRTTEAQLTFRNFLIWVLLYTCYYVLVAAPVLPLLFLTLRSIQYDKWRDDIGRWVLQVLLLMAGFYAAVTRHSWRAYYNRDLPSAIMGRYLIFYSLPYVIIALVSFDRFGIMENGTGKRKGMIILLISLGLVVFSYLALVEGVIIPTDGNLLKSQGSVDAFFILILGNYFFILIALLYSTIALHLFSNRKKAALIVFTIVLVIYYLAGWPGYQKELMEYQTYPWLAEKIAELTPVPDQKNGEAERVSVYLPLETNTQQRAEIYNGLRVRGVNNTHIADFSPEAANEMPTKKGFIIYSYSGEESIEGSSKHIYSFNGEQFLIEPIER